MQTGLIETISQLEEVLTPILERRVAQAGFDTETTEVKDKRFTSWATDTRFCGFSVSYDLEGTEVDFYAPVRHVPYDWRRSEEQIVADEKNQGREWVERLHNAEGVTEYGTWELDGEADPNLPLAGVLRLIQAMFDAPDVEWLAQNWPFDTRMMLVDGIQLPWDRMEDTQALSVFTDPRPVDLWDDKLNEGKGGFVHGGHSLKHLGETWCGVDPDEQGLLNQARRALGKGSAMLNDWSMLPLRTAVSPYACMDTRLLLKVAAVCRAREAYQEAPIRELLALHKQERRIVAGMEKRGMPVDQAMCIERAGQKEKEVEDLVIEIHALAGIILNLGHGPTLAGQLYDELKLPTYRGNRDTKKATLKHVRTKLVSEGAVQLESGLTSEDAARLLDLIGDYRKANKELTSFYRPLTAFGETGNVHTTLSPLAAVTTRFASEKPAVMNTAKPKKDKSPEVAYQNQVKSVRHCFQPGEEHAFVMFDYSGCQMRLMGHYAIAIPPSFGYRFTWGCTMGKRGSCKGKAPHGPEGDKAACRKFIHTGGWETYNSRPQRMNLVEGFLNEGVEFDPHTIMLETCERLGVELDRDKAKNVDFAIPFGAGGAKVSDMINSDWKTAYKLMDIFWNKAYTELGRVKIFVEERLRRTGKPSKYSHQDFIRTIGGARVYLDGGFKGMNYIVQRSERELLLRSIVSIDTYLQQNGLDDDWKMVVPIHDELMFRVKKEAVTKEVCQAISKLMVKAGKKSLVPMVVEPKVAYESWAVKEELPKDWGCDGVALYGRRDPWSSA